MRGRSPSWAESFRLCIIFANCRLRRMLCALASDSATHRQATHSTITSPRSRLRSSSVAPAPRAQTMRNADRVTDVSIQLGTGGQDTSHTANGVVGALPARIVPQCLQLPRAYKTNPDNLQRTVVTRTLRRACIQVKLSGLQQKCAR